MLGFCGRHTVYQAFQGQDATSKLLALFTRQLPNLHTLSPTILDSLQYVACALCLPFTFPFSTNVFPPCFLPVSRLEFDDVFLVDFFSDSPVEAGWRLLLQLLAEYEAVVETIAKYAAAQQAQQATRVDPPKTWEQLASSMTAGELRKLVASARTDSSPATAALARAAVNAADHSDFLKTLPTSARLVAAPPTSDGAQEAGWLRPLDFNPQQHSLLCEELKHL